MIARYRTKNGQVSFELEGQDPKDLFRQLASVQEIFDGEHKCGMCGSADIRFLARKVDKFDFYELSCMNDECRARFAFGQSLDKVNLFPKRKDEDGHWLPNGGWSKFEPQSSAPAVQARHDAEGWPQDEPPRRSAARR